MFFFIQITLDWYKKLLSRYNWNFIIKDIFWWKYISDKWRSNSHIYGWWIPLDKKHVVVMIVLVYYLKPLFTLFLLDGKCDPSNTQYIKYKYKLFLKVIAPTFRFLMVSTFYWSINLVFKLINKFYYICTCRWYLLIHKWWIIIRRI